MTTALNNVVPNTPVTTTAVTTTARPGRRIAALLLGIGAVWWGACLAMVWLEQPAAGADGPVARPVLDAPVQPATIVRLFERPPQPWNPGHRGIDLRALEGQDVHAPADGVVTFAGLVVNRHTVTVAHGNGVRSSVEPVVPSVAVGDVVVRGEVIGTVEYASEDYGHLHCPPHACVHWGLRYGDEYLNPLDWLVGYGPVRLLPLTDH